MNIFILDENPIASVIYHTDKHIVKMPVEGTQLLCNTLHYTGEAPEWAYKKININHPCSVWARESLSNWEWLRDYVILMGREYTFRYRRSHSSIEVAKCLPTPSIEDKGLTPFHKAVPEQFKGLPVVEAYREYFKQYKNHIKQYTNRTIPYWWR